MNGIEQAPSLEDASVFGIDLSMGDFDINAAFQEAIAGVASDSELALDEKVRRMEVIVTEGMSAVYRDFVDFKQMAAQMEMVCNHSHGLSQMMQGNEILSGITNKFSEGEHDHEHNDVAHEQHEHDPEDDDDEIGPKTGKKTKKKKQRSWFGIYR